MLLALVLVLFWTWPQINIWLLHKLQVATKLLQKRKKKKKSFSRIRLQVQHSHAPLPLPHPRPLPHSLLIMYPMLQLLLLLFLSVVVDALRFPLGVGKETSSLWFFLCCCYLLISLTGLRNRIHSLWHWDLSLRCKLHLAASICISFSTLPLWLPVEKMERLFTSADP